MSLEKPRDIWFQLFKTEILYRGELGVNFKAEFFYITPGGRFFLIWVEWSKERGL